MFLRRQNYSVFSAVISCKLITIDTSELVIYATVNNALKSLFTVTSI